MSELLLLIGEKIRLIREARGLSQDALAEITNIARPRISNIERGKVNITLSTLENLMNALNIRPSELFNFTELAGKTDIKDKMYLIELHNSLIRDRSLDEVEYILRVTKDFLNTVDAKKKF